MLIRFVCICVLSLGLACGVVADTWRILSVAEDEYGKPAEMTFTFEGDQLSLSRERIITWGGSSSQTYELRFSGTWAVAGQITDGILVPDAYATFVTERNQETVDLSWGDPWHEPDLTPIVLGHVEWSSDTPSGYVAPIVLGGRFNGDGADVYRDFSRYIDGQYDYGKTVSGTLVLLRYPTKMPGDDHRHSDVSDHPFYATFVPEPGSFLVLALAASALGGIVLKRRRGSG